MILHRVSVSAILFNEAGRILLLSPDGRGEWQCVAGRLEDESVDDGMLREIREELGTVCEVRVVDTIDAHTFEAGGERYVSLYFLARYVGGDIVPGDDLRGFGYGWFTKDEVAQMQVSRPAQPYIIHRAFAMMAKYLK